MIKKTHLYIAGSIIAGVVLGLIVVLVSLQQPRQAVAQVGQSVASSSVSLEVTSVTEVASRELFSGKEITGEKGLIVRLDVTNTSDSPQAFIPVSQVYLRSMSGQLYQMRPIVGVKDPIKAGEIAPGATISGDISFTVDKAAPHLRLYLDTRWDDALPLVSRL